MVTLLPENPAWLHSNRLLEGKSCHHYQVAPRRVSWCLGQNQSKSVTALVLLPWQHHTRQGTFMHSLYSEMRCSDTFFLTACQLAVISVLGRPCINTGTGLLVTALVAMCVRWLHVLRASSAQTSDTGPGTVVLLRLSISDPLGRRAHFTHVLKRQINQSRSCSGP
ncbi:hypothetical protein EDB85DRAFT_850493 [Lactarius pseudohatsudake]|nr:hypothetical protein EDB85DRAFT_850493 [Lactarius pseudohatsudake]